MRKTALLPVALLTLLPACSNQQPARAPTAAVLPQTIVQSTVSKIYVANPASKKITIYQPSGAPSSPYIKTQLSPMGVTLDSAGNVYVANYGSNTVTTYNSAGKQIAPTITGLNGPLALQFDPNGNLLVLNAKNNTVGKYASDGTPLATITIPAAGQSNGMAVAQDGTLWIAQSDTGDVLHLDASGNLLASYFVSTGLAGVAYRTDGQIFIANTAMNTVSQLDPTSGNVTTLISALSKPAGIALDANNNIYVTNSGSSTVGVFDSSGNQLTSFPANSKPAGITTR